MSKWPKSVFTTDLSTIEQQYSKEHFYFSDQEHKVEVPTKTQNQGN